MGELAEIKRRFIEKPVKELVYWTVGFLLLSVPIAIAEDTAIGWMREELADRFGIVRPPLMTVIAFTWHWVLPFIGVALLMLVYHRTNLKEGAAVAEASSPAPVVESSDERSTVEKERFLPWFMVLSAVAIVAIYYDAHNASHLTIGQGERWLVGPAGPAGPAGPQGPQGSAVPAGILPPISDQLSFLPPVVRASARREFLSERIKYFDTCTQNLNSSYAQQFLILKARNKDPAFFSRPGNIDAETSEIEELAKNDFNQVINLRTHPNFDNNQNMSTPGDEDISSPEIKTDFHRLYDQKQHADKILIELRAKYTSEIERNSAIIREYGAGVSPH